MNINTTSRRARHLGNVGFETATVEQLPFLSHRFDLGWSVHATHHWDDLAGGFKETRRVLRPGGRFLIVELHDAGRSWGISTEQAHGLANTLVDTGFINAAVDEREAGRNREFLISGEKPIADDEPPASGG